MAYRNGEHTMNNSTVAIICVALIATPAGYALERFYHERQSASNDTVPAAAPQPEFSYQQDSVFAGEHMWQRHQPRFGDSPYKPGRV
jgi:hypothetical protein